MNKLNVIKVIKGLRFGLQKHSPEILTGIGIAGMVTTAVLAVRATPKALLLLEQEKQRKNDELKAAANETDSGECEEIEKLKPVEAIRVAWTCYIPSAVTGVLSIACLIGASSVVAHAQGAPKHDFLKNFSLYAVFCKHFPDL